MLQVDLIGFHLFEYARNFLNTCQRLFNLNLDYSNGGFLSVSYHGRIVGVRVSHIGVDEDFISHIMKQREFRKHVDAFEKSLRPFAEKAHKSQLQQEWGSKSSNNLVNFQSGRLQRDQPRGLISQPKTNMSTSQSSNSFKTLVDLA